MEEERQEQPQEQPKEEPLDIPVGKPTNGPGSSRQPRRGEKERDLPPPSGLVALIPDSILPPEGKRHLWKARRETLLAGRSLVRAGVQQLRNRLRSRRARGMSRPNRDEMDMGKGD